MEYLKHFRILDSCLTAFVFRLLPAGFHPSSIVVSRPSFVFHLQLSNSRLSSITSVLYRYLDVLCCWFTGSSPRCGTVLSFHRQLSALSLVSINYIYRASIFYRASKFVGY